MAIKFLSYLKFVLLLAYNFLLTPFAEMIQQTGVTQRPEAIFWIFILMMFLPEACFMLSKGFRIWLMQSIEDGDKNKNIREMIGHLGTLWSIRMFVLLGLMSIFYGVQVSDLIYYLFFSSAVGIEALMIVRKMIALKS